MTEGNKIATLVIHAPDRRVKQDCAKSFDAVLADGIGKRYAILPQEKGGLVPVQRGPAIRRQCGAPLQAGVGI